MSLFSRLAEDVSRHRAGRLGRSRSTAARRGLRPGLTQLEGRTSAQPKPDTGGRSLIGGGARPWEGVAGASSLPRGGRTGPTYRLRRCQERWQRRSVVRRRARIHQRDAAMNTGAVLENRCRGCARRSDRPKRRTVALRASVGSTEAPLGEEIHLIMVTGQKADSSDSAASIGRPHCPRLLWRHSRHYQT